MDGFVVTLPDSLREFVEREAARLGCIAADEFVGQLVRDAEQRREEERVDALLLEGLDSGPDVEFTREYWERKQARFRARHGADIR